MPQHPHQRLGYGILKLLVEIIAHYVLYFFFMMLVHIRYYTEEFVWCIEVSAVWIDTPSQQYWSVPWYFQISERPARTTWHYINILMQFVEYMHLHICHPEYFALPHVTYYNLGFGCNLN